MKRLGLVLLTLVGLSACTDTPRADFMARVAEDCAAGDQVACALVRSPPEPQAFSAIPETKARSRSLVQEDLEAMIRGMAQARATPRGRGATGAR